MNYKERIEIIKARCDKMNYKNRIELLRDCIEQYEIILSDLAQGPKYGESKQYAAVWHHLDGLKFSLYCITNKSEVPGLMSSKERNNKNEVL